MTDAIAESSALSLSRWLTDNPQAGVCQRLILVQRLASQIESLHTSGRLHRAVDFERVTIDSRGEPRLADPPAAAWFGGEFVAMGQCPPELALDEPLDIPVEIAAATEVLRQHQIDCDPRRIDIYQLGAFLFTVLTGGDFPTYLLDPLAKTRIWPEARPILARCLGEGPGEPWGSIAELSAALDEVIRTAGSLVPSPCAGSSEEADKSEAAHDTSILGSAAPLSEHTPPRDVVDRTPRSSASPASADLPFQRLGHFQILEHIGQGGMGDVYRAYDSSLERSVAIKVLPQILAREESFVTRFKAEASAAAKINHPNVVPIHYIGEDQGYHFFAMQFVDGEPLSRRVNLGKPFPPAEAMTVIEQCLAGLQAAHAQSLIHRDVKPANVLVEKGTGRLMLVDFGLVRRVDGEGAHTATGVVMGTVDYIAPEQARGQAIDSRADIYALGVMFYQMLAGRLPFESDSPTTRLFQHAYEEPTPLASVAPHTPPALTAVVSRMMAKSPDDRYPTCAAVLTDLAKIRQEIRSLPGAGGPPQARPPMQRTPSPAATQDFTNSDPLAAVDYFSRLPSTDKGWRRAFSRVKSLLLRHAPAVVADWRTTEQQVDLAVAECRRRHDELTRLVAEGESVARAIQSQLNDAVAAETAASKRLADAGPESQEQAQQALEGCRQRRAELAQNDTAHDEQLAELRAKLVATNGRLIELANQRDLLQARWKMAQAQMRLDFAPVRRRWPAWMFATAGLVVASLVTWMFATSVWLRPQSLQPVAKAVPPASTSPAPIPTSFDGKLAQDIYLTNDQRLYRDWSDDFFRSFMYSPAWSQMSAPERLAAEQRWLNQLNQSGDKRIEAINGLAWLRSKRAGAGLLQIAADRSVKDNRDRWMATRALGMLGDLSVVPELVHLTYHYNSNARNWAKISLVRLTGQNFGRDLAAWQKWWAGRSGTPPISTTSIVWTTRTDWADTAKQDESDHRFLDGLRQKTSQTVPGLPSARAPAEQLEALRAKARQRIDADRAKFGEKICSKIESLYQTAHEAHDFATPDVKAALELVMTEWPQSNRAGCACVYLGQGCHGDEAYRYFNIAMKQHADCWWGDGTQVSAMARYGMILELRKSGNIAEAASLEKELRNLYPDAIDHNGYYLRDRLSADPIAKPVSSYSSGQSEQNLQFAIAGLSASEFASVRVTSPGAFKNLRAGAPVCGDHAFSWRDVPPYLQRMVYFQNANILTGSIEFVVEQPGMLLMAVSSRWGGGGRASSAWLSKTVTRVDLFNQGWQSVGTLEVSDPEQGRFWEVFCRRCAKGEHFDLRTEKYRAPALILPNFN